MMSMTGRKTWLGIAAVVVTLVVAAGAWAWRRPEPIEARRVRKALAAGRFSEAREPLARWLKAQPDSAEAHLLGGRVALGLGDMAGAADELKRAGELGLPPSRLLLLQGLITARLGRHAEAEPVLRQAYTEANEPDPQLDEALARVYLETFDLNRAAAVLDRWAREAPADPRPWLWRAEADNRATGDPAKAIHDYSEALKRDPELGEARLGLADALRKAHRNEEAAAEYDAYLGRKPDSAAAHLGAGQNLMEKGDPAAATSHLERALALDPENAPVLKELAEADLRRGEFARALASLDRAIKLEPDDPAIRQRRVLALSRLGKPEEARTEQEAVRRVKADLDRLNKVRERLIKSPHDRGLQLDVARWMVDHGHGKEGARWAEKVLNDHPGDPEASGLLAAYYKSQGNPGLANFYRLQARTEGR
jgi:tetratricopeptide (TPR) repeat protein